MRPRQEVREGAVLAVLSAYPDGANCVQIGHALGVTKSSIQQWEAAAIHSFIINAGLLGVDVRSLLRALESGDEVICDGGQLAEYNSRAGWVTAFKRSEQNAARVAEAMAPSSVTQRVEAALLEAERAVLPLVKFNESEAA